MNLKDQLHQLPARGLASIGRARGELRGNLAGSGERLLDSIRSETAAIDAAE